MKRRVLAFLLGISLLTTGTVPAAGTVPVAAAAAAVVAASETEAGEVLNYLAIEEDVPSVEAEAEDELSVCSDELSVCSDDIPAVLNPLDNVSGNSYYLDYLSTPRDQGNYGTCWAFSATALAEIYFEKNNLHGGQQVDFSELQLAYYAYTLSGNNAVARGNRLDAFGGFSGDINKNTSGAGILNAGGNLRYAMEEYAGWIGPVDEATMKYGDAAALLTTPYSDDENQLKMNGSDTAHIWNANIINSADKNEIKKQIMENGAVGFSYYEYDGALTNPYYDSVNNSFYCKQLPVGKKNNHSIVIVGWDDSFPAANFEDNENKVGGSAAKPTGNGAWLVRNSWYKSGSIYSHDAYFWMSYEDASFSISGNNIYSYQFVKKVYGDDDNENKHKDKFYDNNYQYDGAYASENLPTVTDAKWANAYSVAANVFTVKHTSESLKAVSFETNKGDAKYTVDIYVGIKDDRTSPLDYKSNVVKKERIATGQVSYAGFHTVELSEEIPLTVGENYAVVVTLESKKSVSTQLVCETSASIGSDFQITAYADSKQSYYMNSSGLWQDVKGTTYGNVRIKAYTDTLVGNKVIKCYGAISFKKDNKTILSSNGVTTTKLNIDTVPTTKNAWEVWEDLSFSCRAEDASYVTVDNTGNVTVKSWPDAEIPEKTVVITVEGKYAKDSWTMHIYQDSSAVPGHSHVFKDEDITYVWPVTLTESTHNVTVKVKCSGTEGDPCSYSEIQTIDASAKITDFNTLANDAAGVYMIKTDATCTRQGSIRFIAYYRDLNGNLHSQEGQSQILEKTGVHTYSTQADEATISWKDNYTKYQIYAKCTVCKGYFVLSDVTGTTFSDGITQTILTNSSCQNAGTCTYTVNKTIGGVAYSFTTPDPVVWATKVEHSYENPVYSWSESGESCKIVLKCKGVKEDGSIDPSKAHYFTSTTGNSCSVTLIGDTATPYKTGEKTYRASYTNEENKTTYTDTKTVASPMLSRVSLKSECTMVLAQKSFEFDGSEKKPEVKVYYHYNKGKDFGECLVSAEDYTVEYSKNINAGNATVTVNAKGTKFAGSISTSFKITKITQNLEVDCSTRKLSMGETAVITAKGNLGTLTYKSNDTKVAVMEGNVLHAVGVGTVTITINSEATENMSAIRKSLTFYVSPKGPDNISFENTDKGVQLTWDKVEGADGYYIYRGDSDKYIKRVKGGDNTSCVDSSGIANGSAYTYYISAYSSKTELGEGTKSAAFTAYYLKQPTIAYARNYAKKKMKIKWHTYKTVTGYEIQYATKKDFSNAKKITIKNNKTSQKTKIKVAKKKTYYLRMRNYKTVNGVKYYSAWSPLKKIKIVRY